MIKVEPKQYQDKCLNCGKELMSAVVVQNAAWYQLTIPLCADCLQECADTLKKYNETNQD